MSNNNGGPTLNTEQGGSNEDALRASKRLRTELATSGNLDVDASMSSPPNAGTAAALNVQPDPVSAPLARIEAMMQQMMHRISNLEESNRAAAHAVAQEEHQADNNSQLEQALQMVRTCQAENVRLRASNEGLQQTMLAALNSLPSTSSAEPSATTTSDPGRVALTANPPRATTSTASSPSSRTSSQSATHGHKKLLDLPEFSGRTDEWSLFKSSYQLSTEKYAYDQADNTFRLQKCLTGKAKTAVSSMLNNAHDADGAMDTLELLFGQTIMIVRHEIAKAQSTPSMDGSHLEDWGPFAASMRNLASAVNNEATQSYNHDQRLLDDMIQKLPARERLLWTDVLEILDREATIQDLADWATKRAKKAALVVTQPADDAPNATQQRQQPGRRQGRSSILLVSDSPPADHIPDPQHCALCTRRHRGGIAECRAFKEMDSPARWSEVRKRQLCFCCLDGGHRIFYCAKRSACGEHGCTRPHHKLLHTDADENNRAGPRDRRTSSNRADRPAHSSRAPNDNTALCMDAEPIEDDEPTGEAVQPHEDAIMLSHQHNMNLDPRLLLRIIPVRLYGRDKIVRTHALLDEGARLTLIEEKLADELGLEGDWQSMQLSWLGNRTTTERSRIVQLRISGARNQAAVFDVNNARTVRNLQLPRQTIRMADLDRRYRNIRNLPIDVYDDVVPQILIGVDHPHLGVPQRVIESGDGEIVATKTRLGWLLYGRALQNFVGAVGEAPAEEEEKELQKLISDFHTTENFGVRSSVNLLESAVDTRARKILQETTTRRGDRFETGLLWACDDVSFPDSRQMAVRRLASVEHKMRRDVKYAEQYKRIIEGYVEKGYARKLSAEEERYVTPRTWYLPHFGVTNANKPGKVRLVFDAAAVANDVSLNSRLLTGPDEFKPLPKVLHQFRIGPVGVSGDIAEMFHQIAIRPEDQQSQRFLWRNGDPTRPIETYVMMVMTFGARCSPCSAQFVMNRNALEHKAEHPAAAEAITAHHYVDDYVMSFATAEEAATTTKNVVDVHRNGGFNLRNFRSNSEEVMLALGCGPTDEPYDLQLEDSPEKILGMFWCTATDEFTFRLNLHRLSADVASLQRPPTKRQILSVAMSVFDPFGILCNIMLYAKLLVQEVWRLNCGWDEPVPTSIVDKWRLWMTELREINRCRLPRCYSTHLLRSDDVQLHVFADASEDAFAAVAYWRIAHDAGYDVAFIAGKTRCAPVKLLSIPRLELQAAVLATRLRATILSCHDVRVSSTHFWSDSTTVLCWIASDHRRYKPFVAHRIAEILDASAEHEWRYVPTAENVADDATRAPYPPVFDAQSRWLNGPEFLKLTEEGWPRAFDRKHAAATPDEEVRANVVLLTQPAAPPLFEVTRWSKFERMQRSAAYVLRFAHNSRKAKRTGPLTAQELADGERVLLRQAQSLGFAMEWRALKSGKQIERSSNIFKLSPYLDDDGLMRMFGRADAAGALALDTRRPIILPTEGCITALLVDQYHRRMRHQNLEAVVCSIRQRFWIPRLRSLVKREAKRCQLCKVANARPHPPIMGQLPADRVTPFTRPFTFTGLDYFGPMTVTVGRRHEKRWVALFTCLATRAVHLELAADLSADACVLCLRNFFNVRGVPRRIRSDNGTNFVGADKMIHDLATMVQSSAVADEMADKKVEWIFNSPSHPEAGGCWERMVRCVKRVLSVALRETAPRVETLRSVLMEAANIVNSRPLTHLPVEADDDEPLTPNHFLLGGASETQSPGELCDRELCSKRQWRIACQLKDRFWHRWVKEYLPELTRRTKWHVDTDPVRVGDLVLIIDDSLTYKHWRRGRIQQVFPGPDGRIRNALVKTCDGELRRPVSRLAVLDVGGTS